MAKDNKVKSSKWDLSEINTWLRDIAWLEVSLWGHGENKGPKYKRL